MGTRKKENRKKARRVENLRLADKRYFVFCEGEKTEPLYFEGFKKAIEQHPAYKNLIFIEVHGVGAETMAILNEAEKIVDNERLRDAQVWIVYDKDNNKDNRFNQVSERASLLNDNRRGVEYHAAWSNQCIEYWFILHFDYYTSDNDRKFYMSYLNRKFKNLGFTKYKKNNDKLFEILTHHGNPIQAIKRAKRRLEELRGCTDSQSAPATRVYELVEELSGYLPDDFRVKYIE